MANSSTLLQTLQCSFPPGQKGGFSQVKQYSVVFDTLAANLTIHTTTAGKNAVVVGLSFAVAAANTLTWYSGANQLVAWENAANTRVDKPLGAGQNTLITKVGENLIAQVNTAVIPSMLVYVAELDAGLFFTPC